MTTIFLVRHGETVDNALQIMQGQTQGELNDRGRGQARQVAERLSAEPIDTVVASDLRRAIQTAEIIAAPHHLTVKTTDLLRERDWGSFTGRFIPDLRGETWPDDIESEEALLFRARTFLIYVTTTYPNQRVVAVGHGIINKAILAVYAQCSMHEVQRMMNAEVRVLTTSAIAMASTTTAACTTAATAKASAASVSSTTVVADTTTPAEASAAAIAEASAAATSATFSADACVAAAGVASSAETSGASTVGNFSVETSAAVASAE